MAESFAPLLLLATAMPPAARRVIDARVTPAMLPAPTVLGVLFLVGAYYSSDWVAALVVRAYRLCVRGV